MEKPGPHLWSILEPFFWDQSSVETPRNLLMSPMTCASIVMASGALVSNARSPRCFFGKNDAPFEMAQSIDGLLSDIQGDVPGKHLNPFEMNFPNPGETSIFANAFGFFQVFFCFFSAVSLFSLIASPHMGASMELQLKPNISDRPTFQGGNSAVNRLTSCHQNAQKNDRRSSREMIHVCKMLIS